MSNWSGNFRTNYVRVEDAKGLIKSIAPFDLELIKHPKHKDVYRFNSTDQFGGQPSSAFIEADENDDDAKDEDIEFDWEKHVMPFLPLGEVLITMESGADEPRYVSGAAGAYMRDPKTGNCRSTYMNIRNIHSVASVRFGIPEANISVAEYEWYVKPKDRVPAGTSTLDITDAEIDSLLSTHIPGGSGARDWFLPHESEKALDNVRAAVRLMINERQEQLLGKGLLAANMNSSGPSALESALELSDADVDRLLDLKVPIEIMSHVDVGTGFVPRDSEDELKRNVVRLMIRNHIEHRMSPIVANQETTDSLCLVTLSTGGIMEQTTQGKGPYEIEIIDCQNGEAGSAFEFDHKWEPLLVQYFGEKSKWPEYVYLDGEAPEQSSDRPYL